MASEVKKEIRLEIGHVLFIDIVGYSRLLINEQRASLDTLNQIVRRTEAFQTAETAGRLIKIPTGDGMALVFYDNLEAPVECALEISRALKEHPELRLRMGVHSGPVSGVVDVNERANVAGAGINVAQRVMDCGDAGHILLSKHVAEDLEQYGHWRPYLHDLGECEVKHSNRVHVVNLYTEELGNPALPEKFATVARPGMKADPVQRGSGICWRRWIIGLMVGAVIVVAALVLLRKMGIPSREVRQIEAGRPGGTSLPVPEKSIAVLPFENLSSDKENAYFTDGVQDEILTDLAKIADLKVISRTSVMQYKTGTPRNLREIGQQLGVAHLLEGSVQRAANRVRVNAQLIDARTDVHLWAQTYDRDLADVFAIQSEIAKTIADQLQAKLSPSEKTAIEQPPTSDVTAFDLYSRAKTLMLTTTFGVSGRQNMLQAAGLLDQAVARDPSFFFAYCQLASAHDQLYFLGIDHTASRLSLAETAIQAAFRLRPDAGEVHLARANHLYRGRLNYDGALVELDIARRTLPNDPRIFELTGYIVRRRGKQEEGLQYLQRALELDPRNFFTLQQIAISYQFLLRYAEDAAALDRALTIVPNDVDTKVARAEVDFFWKADTRPLHQTIESILVENASAIASAADGWLFCALAERDPAAAGRALTALGDNQMLDSAIALNRNFGEGLLARMMKEDTKARAAFTAARAQEEKVVQAQPDYGPALCVLGLIDAALGRKKEALQEGRRAIELLPVEKDSMNGGVMIAYFAVIAAWTGEKDLALQQLEIAANAWTIPSSYGGLKLLPYWDSLRGDPRFEKILTSLAPKN
jgi:TolB-like protein/class 3 adenylate cyclase/Tfp pilus assembly protein PilF